MYMYLFKNVNNNYLIVYQQASVVVVVNEKVRDLVHIAYIYQCEKGFEFGQAILILLAKRWVGLFFSETVCIWSSFPPI